MSEIHNERRRLIYPLPANPAPEGFACYNVYIPDDDEHRQLFLSAVRTLARWNSYERDRDRTAAVAAATWREALDMFDFESCGGDDDDEEDTYADELLALADAMVVNQQSGGLVKALGYAIDEVGQVIAETVLPVIGLTLLAIGAAYVVSVVIGGLTIGTVAVAAGEVVELVVATGASASNIVEFAAVAALAA